MSFPFLLRKLFENDGAGEKLNPAIIPTDTALSDTSTNPIANSVVKAAIDAKSFPVDSALSTTSTNAVQNRVVTAAINTAEATGYQVGDLRLYAGSDVPSGWFRCDGSTVSNMATNYPLLYAVLGTNVLPNYRAVVGGSFSGTTSSAVCSISNGSVTVWNEEEYQSTPMVYIYWGKKASVNRNTLTTISVPLAAYANSSSTVIKSYVPPTITAPASSFSISATSATTLYLMIKHD